MSVSLEATPYYHVVSRCVRRAWLWGVDDYAGKDYSHRKQWILDRLSQLCGVFAIDCLAYAVMSNHYHLTLGVNAKRALGWSDAEVVERWGRLFRLPLRIERWREWGRTATNF
jgi:putative transposase